MRGSAFTLALLSSLFSATAAANSAPKWLYFATESNLDTIKSQQGIQQGAIFSADWGTLDTKFQGRQNGFIYYVRTEGIETRFAIKSSSKKQWKSIEPIPYGNLISYDAYWSRGHQHGHYQIQ
ncbi:hypothetical protein MGG_08818 [Pyricularia oryzae 70-15]|uniref:Uncharacterized protein n=3 Tax=Pyricularia oryzae TaxID=318829 RepID=G4NFH9_PYRO7|nr:uncharacterized protein MGG_08818 [Pyricularia oryzae 70-15]EHA46786.1 hypothetical protein MGG_08818 [Pyricularia oryzae 70-15]ELQ32706.1 hypothetical protein OOU_Y34scaffold01073g24 [Pyricularia oryzae Y34]KAI7914597.1 hypothetical protein M9X92_008908 [Pyricularia oryzae]KAI7914926.1 hypothetical protein M0657_009278 [Pyricularia oryzae]